MHFLVTICLTACIALPLPTEPRILDGKIFTDSNLDFVRLENVSKQHILDNLGPPTIWLQDQSTLVYGIRRVVETGTLWFIGYGSAGAGGLIEGETKEAIYFVLDKDNTMIHWGRSSVSKGQTWLSAAAEWAQSIGIELPKPNSMFVEVLPSSEQCCVYFYRPRDYMYYLPLVPPASKLPFGVANFIDIFLSSELIGQLRLQTYFVVRVPPGTHNFFVNPDTDYVVNPNVYRSAKIQLDLVAGSISFVEVGIEAGHGIIEPKLFQRDRIEALKAIKELQESW